MRLSAAVILTGLLLIPSTNAICWNIFTGCDETTTAPPAASTSAGVSSTSGAATASATSTVASVSASSSVVASSSVSKASSTIVKSTTTSAEPTSTSALPSSTSSMVTTTSSTSPTSTPTQTAAANTNQGGSNVGIIVGCVVGVLALVAAGAFIFIRRRKRNENKRLYSENGDLFGPDYYQHDTYNNNNPYSPPMANVATVNSNTQWDYPPQMPMQAAGITNQDHYYANAAPMGYVDPNMNYYNQPTYYDPYAQQQQQQQYQYVDPYNQPQQPQQQMYQYNNTPVLTNVSPQFNNATVPQTPNTPTTATSTAISTGVTATTTAAAGTTGGGGAITSSTVYSAPNSYPEDHNKKQN